MTFSRTLLGSGLAALVLGVSTGVAGSGVGGVFNLGVSNTVNAETSLSGNTAGNPQLRVENAATTQNAFGVLGRITAGAPGSQSAGLRGINSGTNGNGFGVWGFHQSAGTGVFGETGAGTGVLGRHAGSSGTPPGVRGQTASASADAAGVLGEVTAGTPGAGSAGVRGTNAAADGSGVYGENTGTDAGSGVYGCAAPVGAPFPCPSVPFIDFVGVGGQFRSMAANGIGVFACAGGCSGSGGAGPFGAQFTAHGPGAVGVKTFATVNSVGQGGTIGVEARAAGNGAIGGIFGSGGLNSPSSAGLMGIYDGGDDEGTGIIGTTNARAPGQIGVSGAATGADGIGVKGAANNGANAVGVLGSSSSGLAGKFEGHVHLTGKLTRAYAAGSASQAAPVAYGAISSGGGVLTNATTPNVTSSFNSVEKRYEITIAGETYDINRYMTVATPISSTAPRFISTQSNIAGELLVKIFNLSGTAIQSPFTFVTYKP